MIGMNLKITMLDGETHEHPITYGAACAWEDAHPGLSPQQFLKDVKFKQLARLAYEVLRKHYGDEDRKTIERLREENRELRELKMRGVVSEPVKATPPHYDNLQDLG